MTKAELLERLAVGIVRSKARRARTRQNAINALGGECRCCGEREPLFLEFDHIAPRGGRFDRKTLGVSQAALLQLVIKGQRLHEVQLLCCNCHKVKTMGVECPHKKP